jgi:Uma2 family endonuclease
MSQLETQSGATRYPKMTYEEFLEYPFERNDLEWVNGEVVEMAPVSDRHDDITGFLRSLFRHYVQDRRLGRVFADPFQMRASADLPSRAPDIAVALNASLVHRRKNHLAGPADLVIEVVSPGSGRIDRGDKFYEYEKGGVREYWIVDPDRTVAEFYLLGEDGYYHPALPDSGGRYTSVVIDGFWIEVAWLWEDPLPPINDVQRAWGLI